MNRRSLLAAALVSLVAFAAGIVLLLDAGGDWR